MSIVIITGGNTSEREISLISATAVKDALENMKYDVLRYDLPKDRGALVSELESGAIDFAFIMIHGAGGEDGQIAGLLDLYGVKYQCASADVLALTMNKRRTKCVRRTFDLPVADDVLFQIGDYSVTELDELISEGIGYPCVWKELDQGSSKGVHILQSGDDIASVRESYDSMKELILLEEFIEGEEVTMPILAIDGKTTALPLIHIIPPVEGGFDYENKYNGKTQEIVPSGFPEKIIDQCNELALQAYHAVGCSNYGRVDAIIGKNGPILLEINTIPGFTPESLFPKSAAVAGIEFGALLEILMGDQSR